MDFANHGADEGAPPEGQLGDDGTAFFQNVIVKFSVVRHRENDLKTFNKYLLKR